MLRQYNRVRQYQRGGRGIAVRAAQVVRNAARGAGRIFGGQPARVAAGAAAAGYAMSKMKKKQNRIHQRAIQQGQGGSFSKFFYGKRKYPRAMRGLRKALSNNYYVQNQATRFTVGVGKQDATTLFGMFGNGDLTTIGSRVSSNATARFLASACSGEVMITNQDQGNCRLTIYDIIARRDLPSSKAPDQVWKASYLDEGSANTDYQIVGTTPFSSDVFTQLYKVVKVTHVILAQGMCHSHRVYYHPNRIVDKEYLATETGAYKGLSCFTMIVASGLPYNDSTTKTSVSTGSVALDCVIRLQYKYTWLSDNTTSYYVSNNLPASFAVGESVMDIGSGTATTDTPA